MSIGKQHSFISSSQEQLNVKISQTLHCCHCEHVIQTLNKELQEKDRRIRQLELENQQLKAQLAALHRSQFKGRRHPVVPKHPDTPPLQRKKRGAPIGHRAWQRHKPERINQIVSVPAPNSCPLCQGANLTPVSQIHEHIQEDIVLEPRVTVTCFVHQQVHCADCDRDVHAAGPGELCGSYIGPAAKATAIYMRYQLNVSDRKISQFFADFFGLKFVAASAYGFERQAVRRGLPLYVDLLDKVRSLPVAHADETSWRNDGIPHWVWYGGNEDLAAYLFQAHRSTEAAQQLLGNHFGGILVADAYAAYNGVHPKERQSCLAHIKTKAKELEKELALLKGRACDPQARQFSQNIQAWVRDACQAHRKLCTGRWQAKAAKAKGNCLRRRLNQLCKAPLRYPRAESFRQRLLGKEQKLLLTCFNHPDVPPTNNQAERSLRPVVIMRRVIQGTRCDKGLENHSVMRSLFETAKRQGKKVHCFFEALFTRSTEQAQAALYRNPLEEKNASPSKTPARKEADDTS